MVMVVVVGGCGVSTNALEKIRLKKNEGIFELKKKHGKKRYMRIH